MRLGRSAVRKCVTTESRTKFHHSVEMEWTITARWYGNSNNTYILLPAECTILNVTWLCLAENSEWWQQWNKLFHFVRIFDFRHALYRINRRNRASLANDSAKLSGLPRKGITILRVYSIKSISSQRPRRYSTHSSRTRFISASYPLRIPTTTSYC